MKVYFFGFGNNGKKLYKQWKSQVESIRGGEFAGFIDNDKNKHGIKDGIECIGLSEAILRGAYCDLVIVTLEKYDEVVAQLEANNFQNIIVLKKQQVSGLNIFFQPVKVHESDFNDVHPFNHYESPYPDMIELHKMEDKIFDTKKDDSLGIDFNIEKQLEFLEKMNNTQLPDWPVKISNEWHYSIQKVWYDKVNADTLNFMIRNLRPKRIIEIGSGYSTAVILDTNEKYMNNSITINSVEPNPERLMKLLKPTDSLDLHMKKAQELPIEFFCQLEENDILFIDSSHVSKINSDVNYFIFEILPRLKKGVYIHFHDIFYPFTYPKKWIYQGRAYTEMYLLRAMLMNSSNFSIQFFPQYLARKGYIKDQNILNSDGFIWLRRE